MKQYLDALKFILGNGENPVATKRAYTKKVKEPSELESTYRNHEDCLHLRCHKFFTLLTIISTVLNVVLLGTVAVMWSLK